jgi:hypothetical protein
MDEWTQPMHSEFEAGKNVDWLQGWTFAEEDRHLYTSEPWRGGFRWFRSPNVVPIERWRRTRCVT